MAFTETTTRVLVAAIGIPIAVAVVLAGGWTLALLLAGVAVLAALEYFRLAEKKGAQPLRVLGAVLAGLFVLLAAVDPARGPEGSGFATLVVLAVLAASVVTIWARGVEGEPMLSVSTTVAGSIYTGALLSFGLFLRHLPDHAGAAHGAALVFAPVLLTWSSDTAAYFVGRKWGTRKLMPSVSPGKTVQGSIGAIVGTVLVAVAYSFVLARFPTYRVGIVEAAALGLLVSLAAQVGDLAESLFKRDAGVKDSGTLLPGHGGALDRFDSLLFTLPLGYFFFRFFIGLAEPF
ncbi:MAG TPA: phosphatidate cytidylyltransferase [Longimicrobiaceae bacterium]|nr:phosphatidate cytidylyltransferase [Longimicrobiaceae bacterium]